MRRVIIFLLVFTMIFSSVTSLAAPGDIIHTGLKKIYRASDTNDLINDIVNNADNTGFLDKFYREVEGGKYVNVQEEEKAQLAVLEALILANGLTTPEKLQDYLEAHGAEVADAIANINLVQETIDVGDYKGNSNATLLKTPTNYSLPVPGSADNTTKIAKLIKPTGLGTTKWVYKIGDKPFAPIKANEALSAGISYSAGTDIPIAAGKYLLLCIVDNDNKVKAYASIAITTDMVKAPRVVVLPTESITASFVASGNKSGATVVSGLPVGTWKMAVLDTSISVVYEDSKFAGSVDYVAGMDIVVANDAEVDSMPNDFKKSIIIYSENNGKIEKYNILDVTKDKISGALDAKKLVAKADGVTVYNYTTPVKGNVSGTTKINELNLPNDATKWMYALVDTTVVPKLDRAFVGSVGYEVGQDITVSAGDKHLILLATDGGGKVKAYGVVTLDNGMIKDPLAMLLHPGTHYKDISKGGPIGETKITVSTSPLLNELFSTPVNINWMYVVSKTPISIPEMNSKVVNGKSFSSGIPFKIAEEAELRDEDPFKRHLMILATEGIGEDAKIKGYAMIDLDRSQVKYPDAKLLGENINYSTPEKGNMAGTTKITSVNITNLDNHYAWWYKVVKGITPTPIEFKESITRTNGFNTFTTTQNIAINPNEYIVLVSVDKDNKAIAYANILVNEDKITASTAIPLKPSQNYEGPVPGSAPNSTKFVKLMPGGLTGDIKWMYKFGKTSFGNIETGALANIDNGYKEYTTGNDIVGVAVNDKLLLVAVDSKYKVMAATEINLISTMIRGKDGYIMENDNYAVEKGSAPSTTKLTKLNFSGIDGYPYTGWKWMYKTLDKQLTGTDLPYIDQKVDGIVNYIEGKDIVVNHTGGENAEYGYLLLLATDSTSMTKAYAQIPISKDNVRESAPQMADVSLKAGSKIDRTSFDGLSAGNYLYKIDTKPFARPAVGDTVVGGTAYTVGDTTGFSVKIGSHIILYKVDGDKNVLEYNVFVVGENDIAKGKVILDEKTVLEGNIVNGGEIITFTLLGNDKWNDIKNDKVIRDKLFAGLKPSNQVSEWSKVVSGLIAGGSGYIFIDPVDNKKISIRLPNINDYNIVDDQVVQFVIPPEAIDGAVNPLVATGKLNIKPTIKATVSGTVVSQIVRENDIEAGGATIVITLTDASWGLDLSSILDESYVEGVVDQSTTNWHKIKANPLSIVANSDKMVTITIPKGIDVNFGVTKEIISLKIPKGLIQGATEDVMASPNFTLYPNVVKVEFDTIKNFVRMEAPDSKIPLKDNDVWEIKLTNNKFKKTVTDKDISIVGLPAGLKPTVTRKSDTELEIKLTGVATSSVDTTTPRLRVKSTAVEDLNSVDSDEVILTLEKGQSMDLSGIQYEIKSDGKSDGKPDGIYLSMPTDFQYGNIKYSINSKNGIDGTWDTVSSVNPYISPLAGPIKIYVHELAQTKVFKEIGNLINASAPVVSVKTISYDEKTYLQSLILESAEDNLEYNNGDGTWTSLVDGTVEGLDSKSILIVRKKAKSGIGKDGYLPSLPISKLNGLYLGDVRLNVADSKIDGATTLMQYSLNSDANGNGGSWNVIKTANPVITFADGNIVWIREGNSEVNKRKLEKVTQAEALPVNIKDSIDYNIRAKTLTNSSGIDLQYRINNGTWYNLDKGSPEFILENVVFVPGAIEIRRRAAGNELPSAVVNIGEIALPIDPPEIRFDNDMKTIKYLDEGVFKPLDVDFEYKIDATGSYQDGSKFVNDEGRNGDVTVFVRKKPTKTTVASKEVSFKFTRNISFANVTVNVAGGYIDGTTILMQYSTDSTNGMDGSWTIAKAGRTDVAFLEGMDLWIREKDKPSTATSKLSNLARMAELILDSDLEYNVLNKTISNNSPINLEYRLAEGSWTKLDAGATTTVDFVPGNFEFRTRATIDKLESIIKVRATILAPLAKPNVVYSDISNKVLSINTIDRDGDWKEYEYRLKNTTTWVNANLLKNLDLSGEKTIELRKKATSTLLASQIAEISFTKNLNLDSVVLSKHSNPLELNGTAVGMEYKVFLKNATPPTTWSKCTAEDTKLTGVTNINDVSLIIIRDGRVNSSEGERVLYPEGGSGPVDLSVVKYSINDTNISFTGLTDKMQYKIGEDGEWTIGIDFSTSDLSPVKMYVRDEKIPELYRVISIDAPPAPTGVSMKDVNYNQVGDTITLDGFNDKMEYSLDNGANWPSTTPINLTADSDLIVRYKSVPGGEGVGKLPSIPTAKINGLYLGEVGIDASQNLLTNTSAFMEYSLDSSNGIDGKWNLASDVSTTVMFEPNMTVWVREKNSKVNKRPIGPVEKFTFTQASLNNVIYLIGAGTVENKTSSTLEYRFDNGNWITILKDVTHSGVNFKPGKFEVRKKGTANSLASEPLVKANIGDIPMAPRVRPVHSENKIQFTTDGSTWKDIDNTFEYRVGNNGWLPGNTIPINLGAHKVVYVRKLGNDTTFPSKEAIVYFNTTGTWVGGEVLVSQGKLEPTTVDMEYSLNSTDGLNGKWIVASAGSTSVVFEPGMNVWFREKGKPNTFCLSAFNIERNSEPNLSNISYDILSKTIYNNSNQDLDFRVAGGGWTRLDAYDTAYEVEFKSGKLEFRQVATYDKLPSLPKEKATIKASASGPIVVIDDINNKVVSINSRGFGWSDYEYKIGTGGWITAELLATEDLAGNKTIDIRLKATPSDLASQVTQVKFTVNLLLESVRLSTHTNPFELNGTTTEMEYMIYYNDGTLPTAWTKCTATNTKIVGLTDTSKISEIWVRDSRTGQQSNQFKVWSK